VPETSPLSRVDAFMKRFGRPDFQSSATREKIIDMSQEGQSYMKSLDDDLKAHGSSSYLEIIHQTKYIMDKYKQTGEDIIRVEATLRTKLDILDKAQQKLLGIMELKQNTEFFPLLESIKVC
jgi:DNA repair ATPase RecN